MRCVASLNSIMVDATGMCGACMVPVNEDGKLVRKHACIDGPEIDAHSIDWDKFLPRFGLFRAQEQDSRRTARVLGLPQRSLAATYVVRPGSRIGGTVASVPHRGPGSGQPGLRRSRG